MRTTMRTMRTRRTTMMRMSVTMRTIRVMIMVALLWTLLYSFASTRSPFPSDLLHFTFPHTNWSLSIRPYKGTLAALYPDTNDNKGFSFMPNDTQHNFSTQARNPSHSDVTLRVRFGNQSRFTQYTTSDALNPAVVLPGSNERSLAHFDVTSLMQRGVGSGLRVTKEWLRYSENAPSINEKLHLVFTVTNVLNQTIELGSFGYAFLVSSNWNDMSLDEAAAKCSLAEPYVGGEHGFVKVVRLNGQGRMLVITPLLETADGQNALSSVEAWRHLKQEDVIPTGYTNEGNYELMAVTGSWRLNEWKAVSSEDAWVRERLISLAANETVHFAYEYQLVDTVEAWQTEQQRQGLASFRAIPSYTIISMQPATLVITPPRDVNLKDVTLYQEGAGQFEYTLMSTPDKLSVECAILPKLIGRLRLQVRFVHSSGRISSAYIAYFIIPDMQTQMLRFGAFSSAHQWFTDVSDPFGRAFSIMPFDFEAQEIILQDDRSYVVGLSDEAGAGPYLAQMMKNRFLPDIGQLTQLDMFINRTLWGVKSNVPFPVSLQNANHSVRASLFWFNKTAPMPNYNYTVTGGWDQDRGSALWRSYNYVHVCVLYHSMYRLARDYTNIKFLYPWQWYLEQAFLTYIAMFDNAPYYTQFGLMEGSVFLDLMNDLELERWTNHSYTMDKIARQRLSVWNALPAPFGSEMPWDSTGQEEVYLTAVFYNLTSLASKVRSAILAYSHLIPNWAYHGSARRFWDFWINGKPALTLSFPERNCHHYGSSINAKPLLRAYELNPDDSYVLETAMGALTGVMTNIQSNGAASMGFHADNGLLRHDPYDADFGSLMYGHVTSVTSYYVTSRYAGRAECYLCLIDDTNRILPRDSLRHRIYFEPIGTAIELEVGQIAWANFSLAARTIVLQIAKDDALTFAQHRIKITHYAPCGSINGVVAGARTGCDVRIIEPSVILDRGAFVFQADGKAATVIIVWNSSASPFHSSDSDNKAEISAKNVMSV